MQQALVLLILVIAPFFHTHAQEEYNGQLHPFYSSPSQFRVRDSLVLPSGTIYRMHVYPSVSPLQNTIAPFATHKYVLEYSALGRLQSITEIQWYQGKISSCHDFYFNHPYRIKVQGNPMGVNLAP